MSISKYLNIALFVVAAAVYGGVRWYWATECIANRSCSNYLMDAWLAPLQNGALGLIAISALLMVFPGKVFKYWALCIFSWGLPLTVYEISTLDLHKSGLFGIDTPANHAYIASVLFFALTILFIAAYYLVMWWKGRSKGTTKSA